ncbi:hypothetical protein ANCCAN_20045 [Ancylostoma caninum]|uniref:Uncharacterized protein n=1 Tax=Ancylostoma caninum TaxID=29170 RepID=A0A368FPX1_ANCCA|nr:hypothetical protein ANCCAN_20045 [Ancylostoma caninum]
MHLQAQISDLTCLTPLQYYCKINVFSKAFKGTLHLFVRDRVCLTYVHLGLPPQLLALL